MAGKGIRNTASTARLLPEENAAREHWKECVNEEEKGAATNNEFPFCSISP